MDNLLHIRVGKELKKKMQELIEMGLYSNQAEIAREGIRSILLKYYSETIDKKYQSSVKDEKKKSK